jgi:hypothetical protein
MKPKNIQKTNYIVITPQQQNHLNQQDHQQQHQLQNYRMTPTRNVSRNASNEQCTMMLVNVEPQMHANKIHGMSKISNKDANHFSSSSSSPAHHHQYASGEYNNDSSNGIYHKNQMEYHNTIAQSYNNNHNGTMHSNGNKSIAPECNQNSYSTEKSPTDKNFYQSFDSSSSSSGCGGGGFLKDHDFIAKTKAVYEMFEKEDSNRIVNEREPTFQSNIGHSKVQEMKKLLAQQQLQQLHNQQPHVNHEPFIPINKQQIQKSSKELEKLFGARCEKEIRPVMKLPEKPVRRLSKGCSDDDNHNNDQGIVNLTSQLSINISKQIQQKLQQEMKQQCEMIKEKFLIEKIPAQQHYQDYVVKIQCLFFL